MNEEIKLPVQATESTEAIPAVPKKRRSRRKVEPTPIEVTAMPAISAESRRKQDLKEKWMKERAYKAQMVTGKFLFNECPGGELKFAYREFPGDQLITYTMKHDTIHTIPLGVAQHLNDRCSYPEYHHNLDGGKAVNAQEMYITTKVHRTSFIPLTFSSTELDTGYMANSIHKVSFTNPMSNGQLLDSMGR